MLAAFDQVPSELHDNSVILGCLSFFLAFIMLFDLADPMAHHVTDTTQTETRYLTPASELQTPFPIPTILAIDTPVVDSTLATNQNSQLHVNIPQASTAQNGQNGQSAMKRHTSPLSTPEMVDITKNGNYHRDDSIDFVHTQIFPTIEQPVFERVLMPEKKRPTFQKVPEPSNVAAHNVHTSSQYPSSQQISVMPAPSDLNEHDHYSRHQRQLEYQQHHMDRQRHVYKPYHNYGYEQYDEHSDNISPRYVLKSNVLSAHNCAREEAVNNAEPMMVIRNYSQPIHVSTAVNEKPDTQALYKVKRSDTSHLPKMSLSAASNLSTSSKTNGAGVYKQQSATRTNCNGIGDNFGSDDEVDFRKMNSAIRPGFVVNAAKMWDQRAAEQANEFNTIV